MTFHPYSTETYEIALKERPKAFVSKLLNKPVRQLVDAASVFTARDSDGDECKSFGLDYSIYMNTQDGRFVSGRIELGNHHVSSKEIDRGYEYRLWITDHIAAGLLMAGKFDALEDHFRQEFERVFARQVLNFNSYEVLDEICGLDPAKVQDALSRDDLHPLDRHTLLFALEKIEEGRMPAVPYSEPQEWLDELLRTPTKAKIAENQD